MLSFQTIDPDTLELLKFLSVQPELRRTRLVGGTSLALQYGHRQSVDLDFFGRLPEDINNLIDAVRRAGNNFINAIDWMGLSGMMTGCNLTGVDASGKIVYHEDSWWDRRVFLVGDDWEEGDPVTDGILVGHEIWGVHYIVGGYSDYMCLDGNTIFSGEYRTVMPS